MESDILDWYLALDSRTLDLVSDYAGNERFLLEGDSLLLHCFGDAKIDFEGGSYCFF
jgi:ATP-dependent RNA helicase DDX60